MPETPPALASKSAICLLVTGGNQGSVVFERNADQPLSPASITKLLTAITALKIAEEKAIRTSAPMTITAGDAIEGSGQNLQEGDVVSLRHGLANLIMASSNVTANAIARWLGAMLAGNEADRAADPVALFVARMNAVAADLNMGKSRFLNPHGLEAKGQRSTARDLSRLVLACRDYPVIAEFWGLRRYAFAVRGPNARTVITQSIFQQSSRAAIPDFSIPQFKGGKSGTLHPSVFNLASLSETPSGALIVSVALAAPSIADRHADYCTLLKIGNEAAERRGSPAATSC